MLRLIGITLKHPLIKYGRYLIYLSFHESKHKYFGSFHESKHLEFGYLDEAILWKLKTVVTNGFNIDQ